MKLAMALPLALAACATTGAPPGPSQATAGYDEKVQIGALSVTPLDMIEDSRCPKDVQCIWAGRVRLKIALYDGEQTSEPVLTMGTPLATSRGMLTLTQATPYPSPTAKYAKSAYRFTFTVS